MRTAGEIAQRAMVRAGVLASGETPKAPEMSDAITSLGDMLDSWSLERLTVFGTSTQEVTMYGQSSFTIGPSGQVHGTRPNSFVSGFVRGQSGDTPVYQVSTAFMDSVSSKGITGDACWISLNGTMPDATVRLWPVPFGVLHMRVTQPMRAIADPTDELDLPPGWYQALVTNLAVHLCEEYGQPVTATLAATAAEAKGVIKRANIEPAVAQFDMALLSGAPCGGDGFGPIADPVPSSGVVEQPARSGDFTLVTSDSNTVIPVVGASVVTLAASSDLTAPVRIVRYGAASLSVQQVGVSLINPATGSAWGALQVNNHLSSVLIEPGSTADEYVGLRIGA